MPSRVNLHDLPGKGIGPAFPTQYLCSKFNSSFIPKNHHTRDFQLLILHKQNPRKEINQPAVTATISSHTAIQLCVASIDDQSLQTDSHGLHERLPWLVQHSGILWTQIYFWYTKDKKNISVILWYSEPVTQPANVQVFSERQNCRLSARSPTMWP
jgi:hypothetical protein